MKPKRYVVFMFDTSPTYQPIGGWNDMRVSFDTTVEVADYLKEYTSDRKKNWPFDVIEVLDLESGVVIDLSPPKPKPVRRSIPSFLGFDDDDYDFDDDVPWPAEEDIDDTVRRPRLPMTGVGKRGKRRGRRGRR